MSHHTAGWRWDYKKAKWTGAGYTSCLLNRELHQIFSLTDPHRSAVQLLWTDFNLRITEQNGLKISSPVSFSKFISCLISRRLLTSRSQESTSWSPAEARSLAEPSSTSPAVTWTLGATCQSCSRTNRARIWGEPDLIKPETTSTLI